MIQLPGRWSARPRAAANQPESTEAQEPKMANQLFYLETLAGLQADELSNLIESLQGLTAASTGNNTHALLDPATPAQITAPIIPAIAAQEEEEAIIWEQVGTGHAPHPEAPPPGKTIEVRTNPLAAPPPPLLR